MLLPQIIMGLHLGQTKPEPAERRMLEMLREVEVNHGDDDSGGAQPGFRLVFNAHRPAGTSVDYDLVKHPLLQPGNRVVITVTIQAKPRVLVDGIITHQQLPFVFGGGDASLVVMGRDISVLMDLEEKTKSYHNMKHKEVVEQILKAYARFGISAEVTPPAVQWPLEPPQQIPTQIGVTDRAYLRTLATANGYLFRLKPGRTPGKSTAIWGPPPRLGERQPALTVNMGVGTNVETIQFAYDALSSAQVFGSVAAANLDNADEAQTVSSRRKPALAKRAALVENKALLRKLWLGYAGPDTNEARARTQALTDRASERAVTVTGTLDTLRYGDLLMAPGLVGVRGVGVSFDGDYYVQSVKHRMSAAEYKQEFTLTREGVGTTTQRV